MASYKLQNSRPRVELKHFKVYDVDGKHMHGEHVLNAVPCHKTGISHVFDTGSVLAYENGTGVVSALIPFGDEEDKVVDRFSECEAGGNTNYVHLSHTGIYEVKANLNLTINNTSTDLDFDDLAIYLNITEPGGSEQVYPKDGDISFARFYMGATTPADGATALPTISFSLLVEVTKPGTLLSFNMTSDQTGGDDTDYISVDRGCFEIYRVQGKSAGNSSIL